MNIFAKLEAGIQIPTPEAMIDLGRSLATRLPADQIVTLSGDLGAGKTTFVKGIAAAWGIRDTITSPTYNIFTIYQGGTRQLVHMDAYRLDGADAVDALMLEEFLQSPYCLTIEWPEKILDWIPADAMRLQFTMAPDEGRLVRLMKGFSPGSIE